MELIDIARKIMRECGYDEVSISAKGCEESVFVSICRFKDSGKGVPCEPTTEERTEKMAADIERITDPKEAKEKIEKHMAFCPKCNRSFMRRGKERICPDCKKKAQKEATARYKAKKMAERESAEQTAKEMIGLE